MVAGLSYFWSMFRILLIHRIRHQIMHFVHIHHHLHSAAAAPRQLPLRSRRPPAPRALRSLYPLMPRAPGLPAGMGVKGAKALAAALQRRRPPKEEAHLAPRAAPHRRCLPTASASAPGPVRAAAVASSPAAAAAAIASAALSAAVFGAIAAWGICPARPLRPHSHAATPPLPLPLLLVCTQAGERQDPVSQFGRQLVRRRGRAGRGRGATCPDLVPARRRRMRRARRRTPACASLSPLGRC